MNIDDEFMEDEIRIERLSRQLKPCPFCGGRARVENMGWPHHVYCTECGVKVTSVKYDSAGEHEAMEKWNRRAGG